MNKKVIIILSLAAVVFSSCKSLYGKYERPTVDARGLVRDPMNDNDTLASKDTTDFGQLPWRSVFTDPKLQKLIQQGLDNNPNLLNAALNVKMAEAQLTAARLAFLPSLNITPQGTIASWDGNKASQTYSLPVNASWNLDLFGNLLSQKRGAQMALLQTKDYQVAVKTNLIAGIANAYYSLLMLDRQLALVNDMEKLTKETWDIMAFQKDNVRGIRSTAVQGAESNYYSVLSKKADIQRQIRETENALSVLLGQAAQKIERGSLEMQSLPEKFSAGVGINLLSNRPDVHAAEMKLAQCFYNVETARSRFYPNLSISGNGIFTNSAGSIEVNPGKWLLRAVGTLVQPIFQNGKLVAGLKVAKAQYEQAYNSWHNSIINAGSEVSNALVLYNTSAQKSQIEQKQIDVLKRQVEDTRELLASAGSTYLEVIQAQSSLLNVELSKVVDDFKKMQAVINLYNALGGGVN